MKIMSKEEKIKAMLEPLFEESKHQADVVVGIYRKFIPNYDNVQEVIGHPSCGKKMNLWLFEKFMEFDRKHHPECIAGGAWMNWGFSTNEKLGWEVDLKTCKLVYSEMRKAA